MRITILLAAIISLVSVSAAGATGEDFDVPADEAPGASLKPAQVSGKNFKIRDPVQSDGLMHRYVVESRFGKFQRMGATSWNCACGKSPRSPRSPKPPTAKLR